MIALVHLTDGKVTGWVIVPTVDALVDRLQALEPFDPEVGPIIKMIEALPRYLPQGNYELAPGLRLLVDRRE